MWNEWVGNAFILLGVLLVYLGIFGILRFRGFTMKVLSAAKIDTVAMICVLLGVVFRAGVSWLAAKALLVLLIALATGPISSSQILSRAREDGET
ncbi:MAG: monovalent cation/H(+) antiporter subunit G [Cellulomonadaceae bacterium]|jgi:multicomponent Na+:H+ antiporter subunit G|nr:monovalent cation/H(+) antiporter subunit G [Cellulomonadaceae bacterium]